MLYLILLFLSGPNLGQARRPAWTKRPKKMSFLKRSRHPMLKRLFLRIYPMIYRNKTTILLLKRDLLIPQVLSISPQVPSGLKAPLVQQNLLTSQQLQCKPVVPRMMRLSLLALVTQSQAIPLLYPDTLPRKNFLNPVRPCDPITIRSAPKVFAALAISVFTT